MFELLLQADKAVAEGLLDQAERTYWQLIELDPTNAIAVAGLARVSLGRGDEQMARTLAYRALAIDPENSSARRVVEGLGDAGAGQAETELPDLPLAAAERLETLGRRRSNRLPEPVEDAGPVEADDDGEPLLCPDEVTPRSGLGPDLASDLPSEPLRDRRQAGRLAASAAAATAATMPQPAHATRARHEPHHAMPSGKRRFDSAELRTAPQDPYAAAESAAAVEAVDAADAAELAADLAPEDLRALPSRAVELPVAGKAGRAQRSVAMRIAQAADAAQLDAAELEAAETIEAEAAAADEADAAEESVALRISLITEAAELEVAEREAAQVEVRPAAEVAEAEESELEVAPAAEFETKPHTGVTEVAAVEAKLDEPTEPEHRLRSSFTGDSAGQTEQEAEVQALREALAIVLGSEDDVAPVEPDKPAGALPKGPAALVPPSQSATEPGTAEPSEAAAADRPAQPKPPAEPDAASSESAEPPQAATPVKASVAKPESPAPSRKKGLFRRFRGS